jgi:hypothetical protein
MRVQWERDFAFRLAFTNLLREQGKRAEWEAVTVREVVPKKTAP